MKALMKHSSIVTFALLFTGMFILAGCNEDDDGCDPDCDIIRLNSSMSESDIRAKLSVELTDNKTVLFEAGNYSFSDQLIFNNFNNITFTGAGKEVTILDFSDQLLGAQGLGFYYHTNLKISGLTVSNTPGDGIRVQESSCVRISNVNVTWDEPASGNGGYGLYPVLSNAVIVENSYVYGASDAGIYLGQSADAIIRNNSVEGNVAGIEIENSRNVDVYGNTAADNSGGILVFDLPDITAIVGENIRVFDNVVEDNNRSNFASGGIVKEVPAGTGVMVLAVRDVEIFDNIIQDNEIVSVAIFSFASVCNLLGIPCGDDPFFNNIYLADNTISREGTPNSAQSLMGNYFISSFPEGQIPAVMTDGIFDMLNEVEFCIRNGEIYFANLDLGGMPPAPAFDVSVYDCAPEERLPEIELTCSF